MLLILLFVSLILLGLMLLLEQLRPRIEALAYAQIFQIEMVHCLVCHGLVRLIHRAFLIMVDACDYGLDASY